MSLVTIVEGKIPSSKGGEFEAAYASTKKEPLPQGLVMSSLLRKAKAPENFTEFKPFGRVDRLGKK